MAENRRSRLGYGSSYRKASRQDLNETGDINAVLKGQVWQIKPDKSASTANPCIWMQAGVVEFKSCNNYYDCTTCKYDAGMNQQVEKGKQISWQNAMRSRADLERICRHSLTYRIGKRACHHNYECSKCDFDQFFEDVWAAKTSSIPAEIHQIKGFDMPMDYHFHNGHAWARVESGGYIRIGLDDFALKLLGKADALDLPLMGKELDPNRPGWGLNRKGNTADVLSPVGGVIVEVNSKVRQDPGVANRAPYEEGWLFLVRTPNIKKSVKPLVTGSDSLDWMDSEIGRLEQMIEDAAGPLAADGGFLSEDIYGNLPEIGWHNLTKTFLKNG